MIILPLDEKSPWDPESYQSTSRNLTCHPSAGSFGLFAAEDIPYAETFIRPYLGVLHTKKDADFHSTYDLSLCHDPRLAGQSQTLEKKLDSLSLASATAEEGGEEERDPSALILIVDTGATNHALSTTIAVSPRNPTSNSIFHSALSFLPICTFGCSARKVSNGLVQHPTHQKGSRTCHQLRQKLLDPS